MITIKHSKGTLTFPVTPPGLGLSGGDKKTESHDGIRGKTYSFITATGLRTFSLASHFPGTKRTYQTGTFVLPRTLDASLLRIKGKQEVVTLAITDTKQTMRCRILSYRSWQDKPKLGRSAKQADLEFEISFEEYAYPKVSKLKKKGKGSSKRGKSTKKKTTKKSSKPKKYVVKRNDSLTVIAQRLKVNWRTLYTRNKKTIGKNPNRLYPGMVLYYG